MAKRSPSRPSASAAVGAGTPSQGLADDLFAGGELGTIQHVASDDIIDAQDVKSGVVHEKKKDKK